MITFVYGDHEITAADLLAEPEEYDNFIVAWNGAEGRVVFDPHHGDAWFHHFGSGTCT